MKVGDRKGLFSVIKMSWSCVNPVLEVGFKVKNSHPILGAWVHMTRRICDIRVPKRKASSIFGMDSGT